MFKAIKGIIVQLENKHLCYNGVNIEYDFINKTAKTNVFTDIAIASDYNSPLWCPDRGLVVDSDDPKILVGDIVILDFFAVVRKLGEKIEQFQQATNSIYEIIDGKIRIPVKTRQTPENYVYGIFRNGEFVSYNNFEIVELVKEEVSSKIFTMRFDKLSQTYEACDTITKCTVLFGQYAGMKCIFNPAFLLGEAQHTLIDGKEVRFIQSDYILASLN
jgi:hypothetical protein